MSANLPVPLLEAKAVAKHFGGVKALRDVSLTIRRGEIYGLIGPNGAGKTTFFNCMTGLYVPDGGGFTFAGAALLADAPHQAAERGPVTEVVHFPEHDLQKAADFAGGHQLHRHQLGGDGDGSYVLRSPLPGIVVERNLNPGQEFRPDQSGAPLFVVTDPSSLWIQIDAGEADLAKLKKGEGLLIESKQYPGERFQGVRGSGVHRAGCADHAERPRAALLFDLPRQAGRAGRRRRRRRCGRCGSGGSHRAARTMPRRCARDRRTPRRTAK